MNKNIKAFVTDAIFFAVGSFIYAAAVTLFISPNAISPGGFTGIATSLGYITGISSGVLLLILNIPVIIIGFISFGGIFIVKTAAASVMISVWLTVCESILPEVSVDRILASVFGGIMMGAGLSLVMLRGATTGGVDIIAKLINRKFRHLSVGRIILIMDGFVILLAAFVYKNIESVLYSVVSLYASSRLLDALLYGADTGKIIFIVTKSSEEVCREINSVMSRGVTVISAKGGYTGNEKSMLFCTVRRHEVSYVYRIVEKYDKSAFIVVSDAGEILGEGFKAIN